jgi:hypothetical protein
MSGIRSDRFLQDPTKSGSRIRWIPTSLGFREWFRHPNSDNIRWDPVGSYEFRSDPIGSYRFPMGSFRIRSDLIIGLIDLGTYIYVIINKVSSGQIEITFSYNYLGESLTGNEVYTSYAADITLDWLKWKACTTLQEMLAWDIASRINWI